MCDHGPWTEFLLAQIIPVNQQISLDLQILGN